MSQDELIAYVSKFLFKAIVYGGGAGAVGFGLFRWLGQKWIEARFATRLQELKAAQDQSIRYIQSGIDREIHRAKKLYDKEFDVLTEAWRLLNVIYVLAWSNSSSARYDLDRMEANEYLKFIEMADTTDQVRSAMKTLAPHERNEFFKRAVLAKRISEAWIELEKFRQYKDANAILFWPGLSEQFAVIEDLCAMVFAEMEDRLRAGDKSYVESGKLHKEGPALKLALEKAIQERLWSADVQRRSVEPANG